MTTEKQNKILGICASLGLHGLATVVLIFSVSGTAMIPRDMGKLDFVWVSLAAKNKISISPVKEDSRPKAQSTATRTSVTPEMSATQKNLVESETTAKWSEATADDKTMTSAGVKTVAYAAAGGHHSVSDAGRQAVGSGVAPAFSNAYPLYRENPPPVYPAMAKQQGYEGVVSVKAEVLTNGNVGKAVVAQSSGYAILDQAAINTVKAWKFEPAKKSGIPFKIWTVHTLKFVLNDNNSQS